MKRTMVVLLVSGAFVAAFSIHTENSQKTFPVSGVVDARDLEFATGVIDNPGARDEYEFLMTRDPRTNSIPVGIQQKELELARSLPVTTRAQALAWTERGPNNIGGRTRVFASDVANPSILLAGSVAGGIWRSVNDGVRWASALTAQQIKTTSCIVQDQRAGRTNVWYVGTGEFRGSTNNDTRWGSLYRGDGIYKTTDNGSSWTLLPSTTSGTPQMTDRFDYVWNVAADPANLAQDIVYAATYNGIYRSTNGGGSWATSVTADSSYTDVAVSSSGVVYACTRNANLPRLWRSPDGVTWTAIQPAGFPTSTGRMIIAIAPSDPNLVYFFVQGANTTPAVATHQLWKYRYVSGDGSGSGGAWENRGGNLPGDINTQGGYDMVVNIKPADTNFVIIGGTNLYRSTNGFATSSATTTIGGYPYWPGGNHHPDLHGGFFKLNNPNVYYSSHDGGLSRTDNVNATSVTWTNLNNGYNVTQFYSIAIAPDSGSNLLLAGAQDNGSLIATQPGVSAWEMVYGGDGTVVKIPPIAQNRLYTQYQGGQMQRQNLDGANFADMTPSGATNQLFVTPIALDPNNPAILYYSAGGSSPALTSALWRNDDAPNATNITGWSSLSATDVGSASGYTRRITALGISKANNPNVLYYGTVDGLVKRADNANTGAPTVTDITPPGLGGGTAAGGFVRCVAVDPMNSNRALAAFGNYNFQSLWYTTNGGALWTDVEGNLAGPAGPSIRWASLFYVEGGMQVFLGTSIGVLSTTVLNGASTVWTQQAANEIGNVIIGYMEYRTSDRTLAVGTHARGAFTAQFSPTLSAGQESTGPVRVALDQNYPNPFNPGTSFVFRVPGSELVTLTVFDLLGREVATLVNERKQAGAHEVQFSAGNLASGVYLYTLRYGSFAETKRMLLVR